ncbi:MAG: 2-C-methyl-D-erythritol 2,4-cyclodiphosphate synthase [Bacteroidales bacterium]|nr:2-C-methyl-D-erythritol 2,4-cyclodiphosphate synthase [Bacteroidales bacterium]
MEKFSIRVGNGYDVHALAAGLPLNICGVKVDSDFGCVAHSDGDVAIHALCDALLGALALGDIGHHFPDSSEEFKGIDSKILLARVMDMVKEKGYLVGNVDITIDLQKPKLVSYLPQMRATLSRILGVGENYVSIKATTSEGLGFVGRCEGVQVWATALVFRL